MPTVAHVLVIEDDPAIRSSLVRSLTDRGHAVASAPAAMTGLQQALDDEPDLVLLDLGLPDLDGHSLLTMLRAVRRTPVFVVTARDDDPSVVRALDAGADDYVVKPFAMDQLEARMRAVLRRAHPDANEDGPVTVGGLAVDPVAREVTLDGTPVELDGYARLVDGTETFELDGPPELLVRRRGGRPHHWEATVRRIEG